VCFSTSLIDTSYLSVSTEIKRFIVSIGLALFVFVVSFSTSGALQEFKKSRNKKLFVIVNNVDFIRLIVIG
jgi:hypothetical protein